jgi:hypothetical protein
MTRPDALRQMRRNRRIDAAQFEHCPACYASDAESKRYWRENTPADAPHIVNWERETDVFL